MNEVSESMSQALYDLMLDADLMERPVTITISCVCKRTGEREVNVELLKEISIVPIPPPIPDELS